MSWLDLIYRAGVGIAFRAYRVNYLAIAREACIKTGVRVTGLRRP